MSYFEFPHTRTYDSDLGWLIKTVKELLKCCDEMNEWKTQHEAEYNQLKALYDALMSGNFPPSIVEAFNKWMRANGLDIIGELVNMVIFNITDDGYFVAYIPESWDEIQFATTGLDINIDLVPEYGHLVLLYQASTNAY